jgi:hypothetical protein
MGKVLHFRFETALSNNIGDKVVREVFLCMSLLLVAWAVGAEIMLILGGSSMDRARSEKEDLINSQNFFIRRFSRVLYWVLENRTFVGMAGVGLFLAATFFGR